MNQATDPRVVRVDVPDQDENHLDPDARFAYLRLREAMAAVGNRIFLVEGLRSDLRQAWLFAQGRTRPGRIVTHARVGQGWHPTGCAFDVAFVPRHSGEDPFSEAHPWALLGMIGKHVEPSLEWGGDWPKPKTDRPHFQLAGLTLAQALERFRARARKG